MHEPMQHDATEERRHRCEVRQLLRWRQDRGLAWVCEWLAGVALKRGSDAAQRLRSDANQQWGRGSRGERGAWAEPGRTAGGTLG
jgi:hypothetical protein